MQNGVGRSAIRDLKERRLILKKTARMISELSHHVGLGMSFGMLAWYYYGVRAKTRHMYTNYHNDGTWAILKLVKINLVPSWITSPEAQKQQENSMCGGREGCFDQFRGGTWPCAHQFRE